MVDCEETELEVGQKVVAYTQAGLVRGTVVRLRNATRYGRQLEVVKVVYDKPQEVFRSRARVNVGHDRWGVDYYARDAEGMHIYDNYLHATRREKEFSDPRKILVLDNSTD